MKRTRYSYSLILLWILASTVFHGGFLTIAYSQNSMYSDPFLISTDTINMISTMAASMLDKNGYLHIAYVGWYVEPGAPDGVASEICYTNNLSGEFKVPEKLPKAELPFSPSFEDDFYYSKEPSIAVDSNGAVHVAYYRTEMQLAGSSWICYTNNTSGVFSVPQILYYDSLDLSSKYYSLGRHIMLAAGHDNDSIHIVFTGNSGTGHGGARYSVGLDGNFRVPVTYTTKSERSTIKFDNEGVPNIVYWINSDTTDTFSDVNLVTSRILGGQITSPTLLYKSESSFSYESAFTFDQNDSIRVVFRHLSGVAGATQMHYIKGKEGQYTTATELPTCTCVSLMYAICIGNNQTEYIAYKQAAGHQSLGFLFNDGSGFEDISPTDYNKYGFMSAGPQWFTYNNKNNMASFIYTTGQIYLVVADLNTPSGPVSIYPTDNSTDISIAPTLQWHMSNRASSYNLQVSTSQDFSNLLLEEHNIIDTFLTVNALSCSTTYYWRVNAMNVGGTSDWSETWNFSTINPVGINDLSSKVQFQFFPNPVNSILYFEGIEIENTKVSILSMDGKLLKQMTEKGISQIDLSDLQKGTYLLKISNPKIIYIKRIIKQ